MSQNLFENWNVTKDALTDGLTGNKKSVMESVLENTKNYLTDQQQLVLQWQATSLL
jgi:hypothetical protein